MLKWFADRLAHTGKEVRRDQRGFTLIELLVVVIIIGILAAIAIPTFLSQREGAADARAQANLRTAATAQQAAFTETGAYVDVAALDDYGYTQTAGQDGAVSGGVGVDTDTFCMTTSAPAFNITHADGTPQTGGTC